MPLGEMNAQAPLNKARVADTSRRDTRTSCVCETSRFPLLSFRCYGTTLVPSTRCLRGRAFL